MSFLRWLFGYFCIVLQMIDDEPLNDIEEDSPPPPAPNGEHSLMGNYHQTNKQPTLDTSWNPFHAPSIQLQQVCNCIQIVNLSDMKTIYMSIIHLSTTLQLLSPLYSFQFLLLTPFNCR